jgi:hypothetical protein
MSAKSLDPNAHVRLIETTKIIRTFDVKGNSSSIGFETENSVYKWEHLTDPDSSAG